MALIISLSAFAVFVPSTFAQSSGFLHASSRNTTATGVPYFLSNSTLSYGPTARPAPIGLITSYFDLTSTLESAEGSCGQATVTETAYQTITVTVTPTFPPGHDETTITEASAVEGHSQHAPTEITTHTLIHANPTGLHGNSTDGDGAALPTGTRLGKLKRWRRERYAGQ